MKRKKTALTILLNVLFCGVMLWLFARNSYLRPFSGSYFKEILAGSLLLGSLYANYFLLYPTIHHNRPLIYWLAIVILAVVMGIVDLVIAYNGIVSCNAQVIQYIGHFSFFSIMLLFIVGRNLALNFFPFLFRERHHYQQAFENEVRVVYQDVRKLDVVDGHSNIHLVSIDDIFYCQQKGNFTYIYLVQNKHYTRTCSMKHLEQLFGNKDFIRITTNVLVPFRYIKECKDNMVIMKKMPWEEEQTTFKLEPKNQEEISEKVVEGLLRYRAAAVGKNLPKRPARPKTKRKPVTPPEEKLTAVLTYIKRHPNCSSKDIVNETKIPLSTVERCIAVLKKQGHIEHAGSKRNGGYDVVKPKQEIEGTETIQKEGAVAEEKTVKKDQAKENVI